MQIFGPDYPMLLRMLLNFSRSVINSPHAQGGLSEPYQMRRQLRKLSSVGRDRNFTAFTTIPWRRFSSFNHCSGLVRCQSTMSTSTFTTLSSEPVTIDGTKYRSIREGLACILAPYREATPEATKAKTLRPRNNDQGEQAVFYNPIQQFNRDFSVLAILAYGEAAIMEKAERYRKKGEQMKKQRAHAKQKKATVQTTTLPSDETRSELRDTSSINKRKRAAEESEEPPDEASLGNGESNVKRTKIDDLEPDDDELEVMQMFGNGPRESHPNGLDGAGDQPGDLGSKQHGPRFTILDALSATGLRALRYAKEIPFVTRIIANDLSRNAVKAIELNVDHNDVKGKVCSNVGDARAYMYSKVGIEQDTSSGKTIHRFDVIDLDPYGTAAPFFDSALQAIQDGGLLCVTCTDAGVFASNGYPEKAYALYGGIPTKGAHSHEGGLRLILHAIASSAARYGIAIEPLLSLSIDFYARLFVRIHKQQKDVKLLAGTTMLVYSCDHGCGAWTTQLIAKNNIKESKTGEMFFKHSYAQAPDATPHCEHCGSKTHLSGPMWAGPLHNPYFIQRILDKLPSLNKKTYATLPRIEGMLTVALEEDLNLDRNVVTSTSDPATSSVPSPSEWEARSLPIPRLPASLIEPHPFFFIPNYLAKVLHCVTPSEDALRGAFRHLGYRVTRSHCKPGSFRTDAPWSIIWEVMREWMRTQRPSKEGAVKEGTAGWGILRRLRGSESAKVKDFQDEVTKIAGKTESLGEMRTVLEAALFRLGREKCEDGGPTEKEGKAGPDGGEVSEEPKKVTSPVDPSKLEIIFDEVLGKEKAVRKVCRYQLNPRPNWGPMNRAGGN
jgi:tRNA (guanine26-N2/guanine27-N2)-dimethyltransferase